MTIATVKGIKSRDAVREDFAGCSTGCDGQDYFATKGYAVRFFDDALRGHGYHFDENDCNDFFAAEGRAAIRILDGDDDCVGFAQMSWYRMPSGRYEFTGYIA